MLLLLQLQTEGSENFRFLFWFYFLGLLKQHLSSCVPMFDLKCDPSGSAVYSTLNLWVMVTQSAFCNEFNFPDLVHLEIIRFLYDHKSDSLFCWFISASLSLCTNSSVYFIQLSQGNLRTGAWWGYVIKFWIRRRCLCLFFIVSFTFVLFARPRGSSYV